MESNEGFPLTLLKQPVVERVAYFHRYTMAHPKLLEAAQKVMHTLAEPAGIALIFLFGPTGVGKSTLLRRITQKMLESALPTLEEDTGYIPIAGVEAATPEFRNFDWKDFYLRALKALQEPTIHFPMHQRLTNLKLRTLVESALHQRHLRLFYIDEAQNLAKVASARTLQDQTDCIKSLANLTGVQFVLAGTYALLVLRNLNAQLCRRSMDVHFPRYRAENTEDLKAFRGIVQTFQRHLPLPEEPDLLCHWEFCYERSIGCVGIFKDWLSRALVAALEEGAKTLTVQHLETHAWSLEQCMVLLADAKAGEAQLEPQTARSTLRIALGLEVAPMPVSQPLEASVKPRQHGRPVGQPLPKRRPVGGGQHVG
jgi:AAA domain